MKCPSCEEEIEFLNYSRLVRETGTYDLEDDFHEVEQTWGLDLSDEQYTCPDCKEPVTPDEVIGFIAEE